MSAKAQLARHAACCSLVLSLGAVRAQSQAGPASATPLVRVVARDYFLDVRDTVPSGLITIRLVNMGKEPHYFRMMRADSGRTLADFAAWRTARAPRPAWLGPWGGVGTVATGDSVDYTLHVSPGRYIVLCSHPSPDGSLHIDKGMLRDVVAADVKADRQVSTVSPERRLTTREHAFDLRPPQAGRQTWQITNAGKVPHQALLIRIPTGSTPDDEVRWFREGYRGRRPGIPAGGTIELLPGTEVWFTTNIRPGDYLLLCGMTDADGTRHFDRGMIARFTVHK